MSLPAEWETMSAEAQEEWFLAALEAQPLPFDSLVAVLQTLAESNRTSLANEWAELVQDALVQQRDRDRMAALMTAELGWRAADSGFKTFCHKALQAVFRNRADKAMVAGAGFDDANDVTTCMVRLNRLLALRPGALVLDGTWGFGVVKKCDDFYMKVVIDFDGKPQHAMTFAYAAESLTLLAEDHILTLRHRDPAELVRRVNEEAAEVVRMVLRSYGDMPAVRLREILEDGIVDPAAWKTFWNGARRELKDDDLVEIPTRRTANIRLLASARQYDAVWFEALAAERDCETILERVYELEDATDTAALDESARAVLADRLAFASLGTELRAPEVAAAAGTLADRLGAFDGAAGDTMRAILRRLLERKPFVATVDALPARELKPFIDLLARLFGDDLIARVVEMLDVLSIRVLDQVVPHLVAQGHEASVAARFREICDADSVAATTICWLCRNWAFVDRNQPVSREDLLFRAVRVFESPCSGHALRAQNMLRNLFEQQEWLAVLLASVDELGREGFVRRVNAATHWEPTERRGVLARVLKTYPDLKRIIDAASDDKPPQPVRARLTSWRSLRERQAALKKLVEVDIPANSREIGVARSYGDLRENFEYQAAKDRQALLMQRKGALEADLSAVNASDFKDVPTDTVGMGTCVWLAGADGTEQRLCILGEWDRDEALGIVGAGSGVAERLLGQAAGDTVSLPEPVEIGTRKLPAGDGRIVRVTPLDDDIRAWMETR